MTSNSCVMFSQPQMPQNSGMMGVPPSMPGNMGMMGPGPSMMDQRASMQIDINSNNNNGVLPNHVGNTRMLII